VNEDLRRTAKMWGVAVGGTAVLGPIAIGMSITGMGDTDWIVRRWSRSLLEAADVRLRVEGLERAPKRTCVLVCNHLSNFDVLVLATQWPRPIRFVAKAELFRIPVFGQAMRAAHMIRVDRQGGEGDRHVLEGAVPIVRDVADVLFFPEGTRSETGALRPFKKGASVLAISAGVPVVPMALAGTADILPKGSLQLRAGMPVALVVGEPISTEGKSMDDRDALTEETRVAVQKLLERATALTEEHRT